MRLSGEMSVNRAAVSSASAGVRSRHGRPHVLQLCGTDAGTLAGSVAEYMHEGLVNGERLLVIATPPNRRAFRHGLADLGSDHRAAIRERRLTFLDARRTLERCTLDGQPEWARFIGTVEPLIRETKANGLRVYGDMVGLLWSDGRHSEASLLEDFWNRLRQEHEFSLYCSCPIDLFRPEFHSPAAQAIIRAHTDFHSGVVDGLAGPSLDGVFQQLPMDGGGWTHSPEDRVSKVWKALPERAADILDRAGQQYRMEKRFRALIEHSSDAICMTDREGRVVWASAATRRVLGCPPEKIEGTAALEYVHPGDLRRAQRAVRRALSRPRCPVATEVRLVRPDGGVRWVECTTTNLLDEPHLHALVSNYRDITDRREVEERTRRDAAQLARSNAELQAFAWAAAHDLKEPLRTVTSFTQLLIQRTGADRQSQDLAEQIVSGARQMLVLLDSMLSFAGLTFDRPAMPVCLDRVLRQSVQNLHHAIQESGAFVGSGPLPVVLGNESHLVHVLQNLLANAIKYRSSAAPEIRVSAEPAGPEWVIRVRDNGVGIAPEYHERVFEMFRRLHGRDVPGAGMGLAICRKIIENSGGRIWVESEVGRGATFCFTATAA